MEFSGFLQAAATIAIAIVSYFVRNIQVDLKANDIATAKLAESLADFRLDVAKNYVSNTDLQKIEDTLLRIEERLNRVIAGQ
jgi:hypothetical protein